jgi:hypothetical protein
VKTAESRRPSLSGNSSSLSGIKDKRSANRRASDNESLSSCSEKPRKKVKRVKTMSIVPHSPVSSKKSLSRKPAVVALTQAFDASIGSLSPVPTRKLKDSILSPVISPKQQQRLPRNDDLQNVIREKCSEQLEKLRQIMADYPVTSVSTRMGFDDEMIETLNETHDRQRRLLSAEHRAAHERVAKMVLRAAYDILESVQRSPFLQSLESARDLLRATLQNFRSSVVSALAVVGTPGALLSNDSPLDSIELQEQQLHYQNLQAQELADKQTWERQGDAAPSVNVSFPFSNVFDQAIESLPQLIR